MQRIVAFKKIIILNCRTDFGGRLDHTMKVKNVWVWTQTVTGITTGEVKFELMCLSHLAAMKKGFTHDIIIISGEGADESPCSHTYQGPEPFSEVECRNMANFINEISGNVKMYFSIHSFGQFVLYPWGYTDDMPADNEDLVKNIF